MPRFVVDLGDIEMDKETTLAIDRDIQKVVLTHLAGVRRLDQPVVVKFPHLINGLLAHVDLARLQRVEEDLAQRLTETTASETTAS